MRALLVSPGLRIPPPPFDVLFIAPGGVYMEPVLIERLGGVIEITVTPL